MTAKPGEPHIALIVEGFGDHGSVPVLLRKHLHGQQDYRDLLGSPVNIKGVGNATREGGLERFVGAVGNRPGCRGVLVVLDGEGELVCELGPRLITRASGACGAPVAIALADRTFEDWIYASAESLDLEIEYSDRQDGGSAIMKALAPASYTKPVDQPRLTHRMDLAVARGRNRSLDRMLARFDDLVSLV